MGTQRTQNSQTILERTELEDLRDPTPKPTIMKTVWHWPKGSYLGQQNRTESRNNLIVNFYEGSKAIK